MSGVTVPSINPHVLPYHFLPHLGPSARPIPTTTTSVLQALPFASFEDVMTYREELGVASEASVNFLLAFFMLINNLRRKAREKVASRRIDRLNSMANLPRQILSCGFEEGWCPGWNQSTTDHTDWSLNQGTTNTLHTGPNVDHTLGDSEGRYAYMEASGGNIGNTAIFRTPLVSMNSHASYCFRFWYLMYGEGMGSLKVFWSPSRTIEDDKPAFFLVASKTGQQSENGEDWKELASTINSPTNFGFTSDVFFEFQAFRGSRATSDIAVDDISLTPGPCERTIIQNPATTQGTRTTTLGSTSPNTASIYHTLPPLPRRRFGQCQGRSYDKHVFMCCDDRLNIINNAREQACCGKRLFTVARETCCGGILLSDRRIGCCGETTYNPSLRSCCSGKIYSPNIAVCVGGRIQNKSQ